LLSIPQSKAAQVHVLKNRTPTTKNTTPHKKHKHLRALINPPYLSGQLASKKVTQLHPEPEAATKKYREPHRWFPVFEV
jgi:hypothetical protein